MTSPLATIAATLETLPEADRATILARAEAMVSPAQVWVLASHLMRGDGGSAAFVAALPASVFAGHDDAIRVLYAMGYLDGAGGRDA